MHYFCVHLQIPFKVGRILAETTDHFGFSMFMNIIPMMNKVSHVYGREITTFTFELQLPVFKVNVLNVLLEISNFGEHFFTNMTYSF